MIRSAAHAAIGLALVLCPSGVSAQELVAGVSLPETAALYRTLVAPLHEAVWRVRGWTGEDLVLDISRSAGRGLRLSPPSPGQEFPDEVLDSIRSSPLVRRTCGGSEGECQHGGPVMVGTFSYPVRQADGSYAIFFLARGDDSLRRPGDRTGFAAGWTATVRRSDDWEIVRIELAIIT